MPAGNLATTFTKQKLSFSTLNIKESGYVYVWLSYEDESNNWVYFDDFKVTHTKSNVIQYNEYYPFGLQNTSSWTRDNSSNKFLYNAGNELNSSSGWYETFFRGYDPTLGRFNQIDPMAYVSSSLTPYNYGFNDPVFYNDPMGNYPPEVTLVTSPCSDPMWSEEAGAGAGYRRQTRGYDFHGPMGAIGPGSGNHWSDQYRSAYGNYMLMSGSTFQNYYGVDFSTDEGKWEAAQTLSQAPTASDMQTVAAAFGMTLAGMGSNAAYLITVLQPAIYDAIGNRLADQINGVIDIAFGGGRSDLMSALNNPTATGKDNIPIGGRSEGLSINVVAGGGFNLELGRVHDGQGNSKWYFTLGPSVGLDMSVGYVSKAHQRVDGKSFNVNDIKGWGVEHELSVWFFDIIFSGGNVDMKKGYNASYQSEFKTYGGGVSVGLPFGYSMQFGHTWFF